ncbi:MAG: M56 family metallopeptidase, partial [Gramella sp.]|nr:M56 family metallopeptidase [Christiangramia sp.]
MILQYFSEVILFQLIFLLIYQFLLQRETFFNLNRAYLLLTPVIAFFIPFVSISSLRDIATESLLQDFTNKTVISLPEVFLNGNTTAIEASTTAGGAVNFNWLIILYLTGVLIALSLFIYKIWKLEKIKNSSRPLENYDTFIYEVPNSDAAFTYFNNLFVGENISNKDREQILIHELVHLNEKHGIDLAIFEIMKIIFWFNPLVYIFQSKLAMLHEFIADQNTIKQSGKKQYFEQLLNSAFGTQSISFINQFFNHSLIKKRIVMLQKSKSSQLAKLKFILVIPLILAMLTYVACSEDPNKSVESTDLTTGSNLEIKVGDLTNQTKAEEEEVQAAIKKMEQGKSLDEVVIKDDKKEVIYFRDKETGKTMIKVNRIDGKTSTSKINQEDLTVVPFSNIDQAPLFKG